MPYIKLMDRNEFVSPSTPGQLNYHITMLIKAYWEETGDYQGINDIIGALEGAKMEFYRRVAVPYEDKKRETNGDVY